ncbi:MAG: hypothetical protein ACI83W_001401, partial [Marinoscillum sp.]
QISPNQEIVKFEFDDAIAKKILLGRKKKLTVTIKHSIEHGAPISTRSKNEKWLLKILVR